MIKTTGIKNQVKIIDGNNLTKLNEYFVQEKKTNEQNNNNNEGNHIVHEQYSAHDIHHQSNNKKKKKIYNIVNSLTEIIL